MLRLLIILGTSLFMSVGAFTQDKVMYGPIHIDSVSIEDNIYESVSRVLHFYNIPETRLSIYQEYIMNIEFYIQIPDDEVWVRIPEFIEGSKMIKDDKGNMLLYFIKSDYIQKE